MKGNILVVDDEASARISMAEILQLEDYHVEMAENGKKALEQLEAQEFDLMLLDIIMPGMDGVAVMKKAVLTAPDCKVILLTAHGSLDTAIEAIRQGAHDYLLKPASAGDVLSSVNRALAQKTDTARRRRLIEQMEASLLQLKSVEGIEESAPVFSSVIKLGVDVMIDLDRREMWRGDQKIMFTPTEGRLMQVLLENRGRVLSHPEIIFLVQGYNTSEWEAPEILRPLISRLRRKLAQFPGGKKWISNVRGTGYVFEAESE